MAAFRALASVVSVTVPAQKVSPDRQIRTSQRRHWSCSASLRFKNARSVILYTFHEKRLLGQLSQRAARPTPESIPCIIIIIITSFTRFKMRGSVRILTSFFGNAATTVGSAWPLLLPIFAIREGCRYRWLPSLRGTRCQPSCFGADLIGAIR
jgi:hypothetical protein